MDFFLIVTPDPGTQVREARSLSPRPDWNKSCIRRQACHGHHADISSSSCTGGILH
jgi:hypothetical protein